jgi:hypothetical protein
VIGHAGPYTAVGDGAVELLDGQSAIREGCVGVTIRKQGGTRDEERTWDEGPADAQGVELNLERGTWRDPTLERRTRKLLSDHIDEGRRRTASVASQGL